MNPTIPLLLTLLWTTTLGAMAETPPPPSPATPRATPDETWSTNIPLLNHRIRLSRSPDFMTTFRLFGPDGSLLAEERDDRIDPSEMILGKDLTGDGRPELVLITSSGGSGGFQQVVIFTLGSDRVFRPLQRLEDVIGVTFTNIDGGRDVELVLRDTTFVLWRHSNASSPRPRVVLKFDGTAYTVSPEAMRTPPPSPEQLRDLAEAIRRQPEEIDPASGLPSALLRHVLHLVYSGNAQAATELFRLAWTGSATSARRNLTDIRQQLMTSPWYPAVLLANNGRLWD